jgi:hypothetical protein
LSGCHRSDSIAFLAPIEGAGHQELTLQGEDTEAGVAHVPDYQAIVGNGCEIGRIEFGRSRSLPTHHPAEGSIGVEDLDVMGTEVGEVDVPRIIYRR